MIEDHFFLKNNVVDVDAAVVGVSKTQWVAVPEQEASSEKAQAIMAQRRFDVLPIISNNGIVKKYFHTRKWSDYNSISCCSIE
ncbi:MAG: hypothetical protein F6K04_16945, partial [Leptolyngbya sp. SIO4C5]|nr:hypothetical protein [Leptolyngbya sp. SIO4C5]